MMPGNPARLIFIKSNEIENATDRERKQIKGAITKVAHYFGKSTLPFDLKIYILNCRRQMDIVCKCKSLPWVCATSNTLEKSIYIFKEDLFPKLTPHPVNEFPRVLVHEIVHLYVKISYKLTEPLWLHEGLAMFISGQYRRNFNKVDIRDCHSFREWKTKPSYLSSCDFVKFLINQFGKENFFRLLKRGSYFKKKDVFHSMFNKIYQMEFNVIVKEWLEI